MRQGTSGLPSSPQVLGCSRRRTGLSLRSPQRHLPARGNGAAGPRPHLGLGSPHLPAPPPPQQPCGARLSRARQPGASSRSLHTRPASAPPFMWSSEASKWEPTKPRRAERVAGPRGSPTRALRLGAASSQSRPLHGQTHQSNNSGAGRTPGSAPPAGRLGIVYHGQAVGRPGGLGQLDFSRAVECASPPAFNSTR